ncbi:hypothetical protein [Paracoccus tegillarcae]|uniref:Uncharacterized protein n=1 Tax=Paracoccus tegillarcae TaxID=1529068 RepID=A0A2K9F0M6_9RHOB|nr:hypothetical protein [Paracoccus tegillarcae]AUH32681.1 hypothetical protein CUV01_04140 [Paracoccus tegillarcae]
MTHLLQAAYWTGPRCAAVALAVLIVAIFIGANIHLISVAFSSRPDCALQPQMEGVAAMRAAKPSC